MAGVNVAKSSRLVETASYFLRVRAAMILARDGYTKQQIALALLCSKRNVERYLRAAVRAGEAAQADPVRAELERD